MKIKLIFIFAAVVFAISANAQCPQAFSYQTIIRDASGNPLPNTSVNFRFTIFDSINGGIPLHQETLNAHTNQFGLTVLHPGTGSHVNGNFSSINWSNGHTGMQVELDVNQTGTWQNMGTEIFASDPYTLYADSAGKGGYPKHYVGEYYGGGIVFYVTDNGQHGLIADSTDLQAAIDTVQWARIDTNTTNAKLPGTGGGSINTERIIVNQGAGNYAAQRCANYTGGGYGDWFLPSAAELSLLYLHHQTIGGFSNTAYWSSTEATATTASAVDFSNGNSVAVSKAASNNVRAVRAF